MINSQHVSILNRRYSVDIDALHGRFKTEILDPWIRSLKEEGERALLVTTEASLMAAKELITSALLEREDRCKRELDDKEKLVGEERVERLTTVYSNLLAAEGALRELLVRAGLCNHIKSPCTIFVIYNLVETSDDVSMNRKVWITTSDSPDS